MEGFRILPDDVLVQAGGSFGLLGLDVHDVTGMEFRAFRRIVEFQDFPLQQMILLCERGVSFPFHGIDERNAVLGIEGSGQGEPVLFTGSAGVDLAGLDLEGGLGDLLLGDSRHGMFRLGTALGHRLFHGHPVKAPEIIVLHALDKFRRIGRVRRVTGLLEAVCPRLVIHRLEIEQELVAVPVTEEIGMVPEAFLRGIVGTEAFVPPVVVGPHRPSVPVVVALDAEVIVAFRRQRGSAGGRFDDALGQGDAGRDTGAVHLIDRDGGITGNIAFLRRPALPLRGGRKSQEQGACKDNLLHISDFN